jgi:mono/diheme cytochrome c family protein
VRHPLARNVVEGMGTGTAYELLDGYGRPIPSAERYQASTMVENLFQIEKTLWWLTPPKWPEDLLGKIDCKRAIYGKALFRQYCVKCHGPLQEEHLNRKLALLKPGSEEWLKAKSEGEAEIARQMSMIDMRAVSIGFGLNYLGLLIREQYRKDPRFTPAAQYPPERGVDDGYFGEIDLPQEPPAYKARPLAGIWATPPFLHNGSVPSLYELLLPAEKRTAKFLMGTKDFDPKNVGYVLKPLNERGFVYDTSVAGNSNRGHDFRGTDGPRALPPTGAACVADADAFPIVIKAKEMPAPKDGVIGPELTDDQRWAMVEYLKVHRNDPGADEFPDYCHCSGKSQSKEPPVKIPECRATPPIKTAAAW